jgi:sugar transferase (PEP-CTERM/EpsH1 system associated)
MEFGVVKLVNGLNSRRVHSAICSTTPAGALKQLVSSDVPVYGLNRRSGNDVRIIWSLQRLFRRERPDVVHTHGWGTLLEGMLAARLAGVPSVIHGEHGTLQMKTYQRWLQRRAWTSADRVLSVSSRLAERMATTMQVPTERITTIRNGVDLSRFGSSDRGAARSGLGLSNDTLVIGTVGRLVPVKDHATLLEAISLLTKRGVDVTLLVSGDGPLHATLQARVRDLGIEHSVRFLGHRQDVEVVLAALDVFVLSSVSEGLSNTILEAMASGLPVVATRVGGAEELVVDGETGLLVEPGLPRKMAEALQLLLTNESKRRTMGAAARGRVETEFALTTMIDRYEALYMDLAARKSGGALGTQLEGIERSRMMRREYR